MSELYAEPNKTDEILPAVFVPSTRWIIAILLVMGPLLQAIEFLLESGMDDNAARVAFWSEFPSRTGLSMAS